jgi:hypothetical protein
MGSVGLEASLPRPPWKETTPFTLRCPRAASSAPVPQNNPITTILSGLLQHELIDLMLMKFVLIFLVVRFIVTRFFLAASALSFGNSPLHKYPLLSDSGHGKNQNPRLLLAFLCWCNFKTI